MSGHVSRSKKNSLSKRVSKLEKEVGVLNQLVESDDDEELTGPLRGVWNFLIECDEKCDEKFGYNFLGDGSKKEKRDQLRGFLIFLPCIILILFAIVVATKGPDDIPNTVHWISVAAAFLSAICFLFTLFSFYTWAERGLGHNGQDAAVFGGDPRVAGGFLYCKDAVASLMLPYYE